MVALNVDPADGPAERVELVDPFVVVCGFTGRDAEQVAAHVAELGELGVAVPSSTPVFIPVPGSLLNRPDNGSVAVSSRTTSGEAEPVLIRVPGRGDLFAVGSDHTDRALEAESIAAAKKACPKFISSVAWPFEEVSDRWDRLELTAMVNGATEPVLESTLAAITHPSELISMLEASLTLPDDRPSVLFLGTVAGAKAHAELGGVSRFAAELRDPDTDRTLVCAYDIREPAEDAGEAAGGTEVARMKEEREFFPVAEVPWEEIEGSPGQSERILAGDKRTPDHSRMLRFEPNTRTTETLVHDFWEEVWILEGSLHDLRLDQTFTAGMYACRPPGMPHGPWETNEGCLTFEVRYRDPRPR